MKRSIYLMVLAFILAAGSAHASTIFINPTCANNGDGTVGSPCAASGGAAGPRNTIVGVTWTAGNTYSFFGGTTQNLTSFLIAGSGTAGNPITLNSYGTGQATLAGVGSYGIAMVNRSYITFDNLRITSNTQHGIYFSVNTTSTDLTVKNCTIENVTSNGIQVGDTAAATDIDNLTITGNTFNNIGSNAIGYATIHASSATVFSNHTITNNIFTNFGSTTTKGAISVLMNGGATWKMNGLKLNGNTFINSNNGDTSPGIAAVFSRTPLGTVHEDIYTNVEVYANMVSGVRGGGINIAHFYGSTYIHGNNFTNLDTNAALSAYYGVGGVISANTFDTIRPLKESSFIDGAGIDVEFTTGATIARNTIKNAVGNATPFNNGEGMLIMGCVNCYIIGNLSHHNKYGLVMDGAGAVDSNYILHNTFVYNTSNGVYASIFDEQLAEYGNNIFAFNGGYGFAKKLGAGADTLVKNIVYGNTLGGYQNISAGGTDLQVDPMLISTTDYRPASGSPAHRSGTMKDVYQCIDVRGRQCWIRPDIGAYQSSSGDPAMPRSTRN